MGVLTGDSRWGGMESGSLRVSSFARQIVVTQCGVGSTREGLQEGEKWRWRFVNK